MEKKLFFEKLPFIYELQKTPNNHVGIPNCLPFILTLDTKYNLVKQEYNEIVNAKLNQAYQISSILGGNTTEDEAGEAYANSMISFINKIYKKPLSGIKVLDIGCGTGYLLYKLKKLGCEVYGVEPGQQAKIGIDKYNIPIVIDFFPTDKINHKFDLIISTLVLEHIEKPEKFIENIKEFLNDNGSVVIGVPDEEPYIASGDISTLFHEHWNYFTKNSLCIFLKANNASNIEIENSSYGGIIYAKFDFEINNNIVEIENKKNQGLDFLEKIKNSNTKLEEFFVKNKNKTIGIYVPGRIVNFLSTVDISLDKLKFYDDDINSYQMYFPGINIQVENFDDFKLNQPEILLIMSSFFGDKIKNKVILNTNFIESNIYLWSDFYNQN
jgi:SAM-dependent methyltransferase